MKLPKNRLLTSTNGFTIIEVLIALAVAGFILLVVLIALPAANRNSRNYGRKHTSDLILTQMSQYAVDNGHLPASQAEGDAFLASYIPGLGSSYDVHFRDNSAPHSDIPNYDQIFVQYGHWCSSDHGGAEHPGDPIATAPGGDTNNHYDAVWTLLENNNVYCIDNG